MKTFTNFRTPLASYRVCDYSYRAGDSKILVAKTTPTLPARLPSIVVRYIFINYTFLPRTIATWTGTRCFSFYFIFFISSFSKYQFTGFLKYFSRYFVLRASGLFFFILASSDARRRHAAICKVFSLSFVAVLFFVIFFRSSFFGNRAVYCRRESVGTFVQL